MIAQTTQNTTSTIDTQTKLFWVTRNGVQVRRRWSELTKQEQQWQREADERAAYVSMFNIY